MSNKKINQIDKRYKLSKLGSLWREENLSRNIVELHRFCHGKYLWLLILSCMKIFHGLISILSFIVLFLDIQFSRGAAENERKQFRKCESSKMFLAWDLDCVCNRIHRLENNAYLNRNFLCVISHTRNTLGIAIDLE